MPGSEGFPDNISEHRVVSEFDVHVDTKIILLERLKDFFQESMSIVSDTEETNAWLEAAGRADLAIEERVDPAELRLAENPDKLWGNFIDNFNIVTKSVSRDGRIPATHITSEELDNLKTALPRITSDQQLEELKASGQFPGLGSYNHIYRAAFLRMLVLFPDFTKGLVLESNSDRKESLGDLKFNYLIAEALLSYLIDRQDYAVTKSDGSINSGYLRD